MTTEASQEKMLSKKLNEAMMLVGLAIGALSGLQTEECCSEAIKMKLNSILDALNVGADHILSD